MSEATASSTETVFVRLLGEGVDVWRPVAATLLESGLFRLDDAPVPDGEAWESDPGTLVRADSQCGVGGPLKVARAVEPVKVRRAG